MTVLTVLGIALVVALSWVAVIGLAACLIRLGFTTRVDSAVLGGAVIGVAAIYVAAELLSLLNLFTITGVWTMSIGGVFVLGVAVTVSSTYRAAWVAVGSAGSALARRQPLWLALNALGLLLLIFYAPSNFDGLSFHIARAAVWLQNGSLEHFSTHFIPQLDRPPVAETMMAWARSISGTWDAAPLVQWHAGVLLAVGIRAIMERLLTGLDRLEEFTVLVAIGLSPMIIAQTTTPQVDLVAVALVTISSVLVIDAVLNRQNLLLPIGGLGLGVAVATKGTAIVGIAALAIAFAPTAIWYWISRRRVRTTERANLDSTPVGQHKVTIILCVAAAAALVLPITPTFMRNHQTFGTLSGPEQGVQVVATNNPQLVLANAVRQLGPNIQMGSDGDLSHTISRLTLRVASEISLLVGGDQAATAPTINFPSADPWANVYPSTAVYHEDVAASPLVYFAGAIALTITALLWRRRSAPSNLLLGSLILSVVAAALVSARLIKLQYWVNRLTLPLTVTILVFALATLLISARLLSRRGAALWPVALMSCWIWLAVTISGPTRPLVPIGNEVAQHRWGSTSYDRYFGDRVGPGLDFDALEGYLKAIDCDTIGLKSFLVYELPLHVVAERTGTTIVSINVPEGSQSDVDDYCLTVEENSPDAATSDLDMPFGYLSVQLVTADS